MKKNIVISFAFYCLFYSNRLTGQVAPAENNWYGPQPLELLNQSPVSLIPFPQKLSWDKEKFVTTRRIIISVAEKDRTEAKNAIRSIEEVLTGNGIEYRNQTSSELSKEPTIRLSVDNTIHVKAEGYLLTVNATGISITGKDAAGLFYGVQTLRQLIRKKGGKTDIPGCVIEDWPAFSIRGFMHDNGRNFQSIELLKAQLDRLSQYKFNIFHWHLTDNPAWRIESKIYPQLNNPSYRQAGRDPDSTYSFEAIRELIRYAKERCMTIIPELDMPGHSRYFETTFGFNMGSEEGMKILEKLIDEFCGEIPATDCPVIHLGSDEVHISNPEVFISRMTSRVKANRRKVMVWNPGLIPERGTIEQVWREGDIEQHRNAANPYVDSYGGYLNNFDALTIVQRNFFHQICDQPVGDSLALGGILCCWPDVRVDKPEKTILYNAVWPAALTFSEAVWCGRPSNGTAYMKKMPKPGSSPALYFNEFEKRLAEHRDRFFKQDYFPFVLTSQNEWVLSGPYYRQKGDLPDKVFATELQNAVDTAAKSKVYGGVFLINNLILGEQQAKLPEETVYLSSNIFSKKRKTIDVMLGFEAAARSTRLSGGIPLNGKWDANGGAIFINGIEYPGPHWNNPGGNRYLEHTWDKPGNEVPYTDEEFFWARTPAKISLQKGWNKIVVRIPRAYSLQRWMFAFVPVKMKESKWVEDSDVQLITR